MPDITHQFPIRASIKEVFDAISTPEGLDAWWTLECSGTPYESAEYKLGFGPGYSWRASVSKCLPDNEFELKLIKADADWTDSTVRFLLEEKNGLTEVHFRHTGWPAPNDHFEISCFCWAMYLRLLKRYVEFGEIVPYDRRLEV